MSSDKKFGAGVMWSYLQSWMARGITTISFLIVGWYLNPADFGMFAVVAATLMFAELLCEQAASQVIVQLKQVSDRDLSAVFSMSLLCGLLFVLGILVGAPHIARTFDAPELTTLLQLAAICPILIALTTVPLGLLRRELDFKALAQRTVLSSGISSGAGIAMVIAGHGALGLVLQAVLYYAVSLLFLWKHCTWRPSLEANWHEGLQIAKLGFWNAANKITDFAETRGLELLIGVLGGVHELGVFAFASKLAQTAFQTVSSPAIEVVFAQIARQRDMASVKQAVRNGQLIIGSLPTGLMFGLTCIAAPLLSVLYGHRWDEAALPLRILALAYLVRGMLYVFGSAMLALGESRVAAAITVVRASATLILGAIALLWLDAMGASAWGYLVSALLVGPVSLIVISKKIGINMKALLAVPLKVTMALLVGVSVVALGQLTQPGNLASIAIATLAGGVFLLAVTFLNAGLIVRGMKAQSKTGTLAKALSQIQRFAQWTLDLREYLGVQWFEISLRIASRVFSKRSIRNQILVIPGDTAALDGSLGDQALLLGFQALTAETDVCVVVSETFQGSHLFKNVRVIHAWSGLAAGWRLGREVAKTKAIYVIGADVMDGFYSAAVSCQRLVALRVFHQHHAQASVLGFSFNPQPHPQVVREFQRLPEGVRICLRDAVSLERFERLVGRPASLVADLAFLVEPMQHSEVARYVSPWVEQERRQGRQLLGINVNPHVVAHLAADAESSIARSVAQACETLVQTGTSLVLIPHDFRPGCADLRVMKLVWQQLSEQAKVHTLLLEQSFTAQEIKSVCVDFDLVFSARMHLAIGALSVGTPVCGMQYQGKFAGLFQHFHFDHGVFVSPEDALDPQRLAAFLQNHLQQCRQLQQQVKQHLDAVRALAHQNVVQAGV